MSKITSLLAFALFCFIILNAHAESDKFLDNYEEEARLFGVAGSGEHIDKDLDRRLTAPYYFADGHDAYNTEGFAYDFSDKKVGDFCVTYRPAESGNADRFGFMTNLWGRYPNLNTNDKLKFYLKTEGLSEAQSNWKLQMVDSEGRIASGAVNGANSGGKWKEIIVSIGSLEKDLEFNLEGVVMCEFTAPEFPPDALIKFDFVHFESKDGVVVGVTDKTMKQRIAEQEANRDIRIRKAFEVTAKKAHLPVVSAFAMMYLNQDLAEANRILREDCKEMVDKDPWSLLSTPLYCRFYYHFSSRSGKFPGRLEPETEKILLETIWKRTALKNDIYWARESTWWMDGSENHDLNAKACNLVSSRIFMNEPEYKDRVYPNYGFGGGYHYGHAGYYGKGIDPAEREGGGRANLSDGKKYTAKDHYEEWLAFMKEYFRERARHGFFLENSSSTYSKHTMNMVDLAYAYSGDEELKNIIGDFMTLYWADWAQAGIAGLSGGPKTRHHKTVGGYNANKGMLMFHVGGPADAGIWNYWNIINGYELPEVVQRMLLDREGMGHFVYQSRGIGEEAAEMPRPMGTERTMIINPESRFLKYVYVAPQYTLGTQMDHPLAVHSHLSKAGRWHGMTVAQDPDTRIVPVAFPTEPDFFGRQSEYSLEAKYKAIQHRNTLILQRCRSFTEVNPDWYPLYKQRTDQGVYIGTDWDEQIEKEGWVFVRKGDVYAGVRVVLWDAEYEAKKKEKGDGTQKFFHGAEDDATVKLKEKPYTFSEDGKFLHFEDRYSPLIIQSGDREQFGNFESFMSKTLQAEIALYKTVVPTFNILAFTPPGKDAPEMVFNAGNMEIPMLDGDYITYEYPMTFDSPFMKSPYGSGVIDVEYGGDSLKLDFSENHGWSFWR